MPGMEAAFEKQDWFTRYPETRKSIVALLATEHLGQIEYKEDGLPIKYFGGCKLCL
jgi:hypothetical protein